MLKKQMIWPIRIISMLISLFILINIILLMTNYFSFVFSGDTVFEKVIKLEENDISEIGLKNIHNVRINLILDLTCPNYDVKGENIIPLFHYPSSIVIQDNQSNILYSRSEELSNETILKQPYIKSFSSAYGFKKLKYAVPILKLNELNIESFIIKIHINNDIKNHSIMNNIILKVEGNFEEYDSVKFTLRFALLLLLFLVFIVICVVTFKPKLI